MVLMLTALGIMTSAGGLFLYLWYRTVVGLPRKVRPPFTRPGVFRWGIPGVSAAVFMAGLFLLYSVGAGVAAAAAFVSIVLVILIARLDRYSAEMRMIRDRYLDIRRANPGLEDGELLLQTARWRYPTWSYDRLVELVAAKDIQSLVLLMIINENGVNPISDWELYRSLKAKVMRIVRTGE
jgi:hypothetical protein